MAETQNDTEITTPNTFRQAMNSPDKDKWIISIKNEWDNFISRGAWKMVDRDTVISKGQRVLKTKKVFKIKTDVDGNKKFKTREVLLGYLQVKGEDYDICYSPVAKDSTMRIALALNLYHREWTCHTADVEAAFLNPKKKKPMYFEMTQGSEELGLVNKNEIKNKVIETYNGMYGSVDAAIGWMNDFSLTITCDFKTS